MGADLGPIFCRGRVCGRNLPCTSSSERYGAWLYSTVRGVTDVGVAGFGPAIEGSNPSAPVLAFMRVCGVSAGTDFGRQGVRGRIQGAFGPEDPCGFAASRAGSGEKVPRSRDRLGRREPSADAGLRCFSKRRRFLPGPRSKCASRRPIRGAFDRAGTASDKRRRLRAWALPRAAGRLRDGSGSAPRTVGRARGCSYRAA